MKKILYFDCFSGISGDMTLGALIDLGLSPKTVEEELGKLGIDGYSLHVEKTHRHGIAGTDVDVVLTAAGQPQTHHHHHDDHHGHSYGHDQNHNHDHNHDEAIPHSHNGHSEERNLQMITAIIEHSSLSQNVKSLSIAIFTEIAKAEAHVHGKPIEEVHFHEVGAVDSIVDIVGAAICIDLLQVDHICCSPVHEGQGFVRCAHGLLPVPVPAVMAMLSGSHLSLVTEDIQGELVTPTGIGILKALTVSCGAMPQMQVEGTGYGFGKKDTGRLNALRVVLGTAVEENAEAMPDCAVTGEEDEILLLETNLDDCTGEVLGYTMERLMAEGALDVFFSPIYMKKNRPAYLLSVLCREENKDYLANIVFQETGSLGIRYRRSRRMVAGREVKETNGDFGPARLKQGSYGEHQWTRPEYEDCAELARKNQLSLNDVYEMVKRR